MNPTVFIFIGQSGSGKGTQAALLEKKIRQLHQDISILHLETGTVFRSFIETTSYTADKTKSLMDEGLLPPAFIGVHVWSHELIASYSGQDVLILDGTPRVKDEVPILLSAARFYGLRIIVIHLDVSDAWADERLRFRGRVDDTVAHERAERLKWFHASVVPAIELLHASPDVTYIRINGEHTIEDIHTDICTQVLQ